VQNRQAGNPVQAWHGLQNPRQVEAGRNPPGMAGQGGRQDQKKVRQAGSSRAGIAQSHTLPAAGGNSMAGRRKGTVR